MSNLNVLNGSMSNLNVMKWVGSISNLLKFTNLYIFCYLGTCNELPQESNLWTDSVLPVKKGTVLVVDCVKGYTLAYGERVLTCVQDSEYTVWRQFPSCTVGRFKVNDYFIFISFIFQVLYSRFYISYSRFYILGFIFHILGFILQVLNFND